MRKFNFAGGVLADLQDVRHDIGVLLSGQLAGVAVGHRDPDAFEQIADRQAVPVPHEGAARQRRRHVGTFHGHAMARRTFGAVDRFAALRLFL